MWERGGVERPLVLGYAGRSNVEETVDGVRSKFARPPEEAASEDESELGM